MSNSTETSPIPNVWTALGQIEARWVAVELPPGKTQINSHEELLELLVQRVERLIHRWVEEEEVSLEEAYALIDQRLGEAGMLPWWPGTEAPPREWVESFILRNEVLSGKILWLDLRYPLQALTDPDQQDRVSYVINEMTLDEWLLEMRCVPEERD